MMILTEISHLVTTIKHNKFINRYPRQTWYELGRFFDIIIECVHSHNTIQIHNNVMRDSRYSIESSTIKTEHGDTVGY